MGYVMVEFLTSQISEISDKSFSGIFRLILVNLKLSLTFDDKFERFLNKFTQNHHNSLFRRMSSEESFE